MLGMLPSFVFPSWESRLYGELLQKVISNQREGYNRVRSYLKTKGEEAKITPPVSSRREYIVAKWDEFPQWVEEWRKENLYSLVGLRLKALLAEVSSHPTEQQAKEGELAQAIQSLISQWIKEVEESKGKAEEREEIHPAPLSIPIQEAKGWWNAPSFGPLSSSLEMKGLDSLLQREKFVREALTRDLAHRQRRLEDYERILREIRKRCPLP